MKRSFLIWAVTGAGKTEMVYPLIEHELARQGRILFAAPRRDVVVELAPRLRRAFPDIDIAVLYGGSEERWKVSPVTLATTHQLMRFRHAFDLAIIDELDAFPFHRSETLYYAANRAVKPEGLRILLSATPPSRLILEAKRKRLNHVKVAVRYHRHPLPVPKRLTAAHAKTWSKLPRKLNTSLLRSVERGAQLFFFVPAIAMVDPLVRLLREAMPAVPIEGTHSKDPNRGEKVEQFRNGAFRLLVTTTILERGVTIPKSDVFIVDADSRLFDEAALVQMAGRAGRSADDPAGKVIFAAASWTRSQAQAVSRIKAMNRLARRKGYLQDGG